ncbi:acetyltransferase [Microbacterium pseudoresistens]|uniref:PglD N-terminal domain-containing protein n=1 Tax=Microbacterium pseudoresistens TaxID=640634 RepID=A0A7Y9EVA1_9MICO|nr:acetyltransferase [Microbacterium pseudoresistens]NYD54585.1 hypothetical protein [Microbacterium pseudoresistens]
MHDLVVVGAGGFGREVLDVADAMNSYRVIGVLDDSLTEQNAARLRQRGIDYLGAVDSFAAKKNDAQFVIGIGSASVRAAIDSRMTSAGFEAATLVHPESSIGSLVSLGPGTVVCAGVRMTTNVTTGRHCHFNLNATIGHDVSIDDYVTVNPGAAVSGEVELAESVLIGANSFVLQGLEIGAKSIVGAMACVTRAVPSEVTVAGVPARVISRR